MAYFGIGGPRPDDPNIQHGGFSASKPAGMSDEDYAQVVATVASEVKSRGNLLDAARIADVIANRLADPNQKYGKTLTDVVLAKNQFSGTSKKQSEAYKVYEAVYNAVKTGDMRGINRQAGLGSRLAAVKSAVDGVYGTGTLRGSAKGATHYDNRSVTAKRGTAGSHIAIANAVEKGQSRKNGSFTVGGHTFTGSRNVGFDPKMPDVAPDPFAPGKASFDNQSRGPFGLGGWQAPGNVPSAPASTPYSSAALDFGPDFASPPSQARGPVTDPYGFSNVNTAVEAAPGSFAGYGPNAFGALDQDYGTTYPDISAGLYGQAPAPMSNEDFNAAFQGMPADDATGSVRMSAAPASFAPAINAPQVGGPYGFSSLQSLAPGPDAATIPNDVTGYGVGGAFGTRAPSPAFDFESVFNASPMSGAAPANAPAPAAQEATTIAPAESSAAFNSRMSDLLSPGLTGGQSPFQGTPLGLGQGIIDQGPYSSPLGPNPNSFSPANLGNPMPNSTAVATQAPQITGYENKTITRDVPNPAWSDWSKDYATRNASQEAWLAADEDKFGWDRAPPNPSLLADTKWAGFRDEPPKTIPETRVVQDLSKPTYSNPAVNVPAVNAQPATGSAIQAQPSTWTPGMTQQANAFTSLMGNIGSYGLQGVPGTFATGFDLAGLGGGYGQFGGGYDTSGGYGGYGGTAPGDAGYGSDARSGASNMGAGNLYN